MGFSRSLLGLKQEIPKSDVLILSPQYYLIIINHKHQTNSLSNYICLCLKPALTGLLKFFTTLFPDDIFNVNAFPDVGGGGHGLDM